MEAERLMVRGSGLTGGVGWALRIKAQDKYFLVKWVR